MKREEFMQFGINWMSNAVVDIKQDYLKKEVIIKSLKKVVVPASRMKKNNFFSFFREGKDIEEEIAYVGKKIAKDTVEAGDVEEINKLLEGTMFKALDSLGPIHRSIIRTTSQKYYMHEFNIALRSDEDIQFACSDKGCKKSKRGCSYKNRSTSGEVVTAENIYYLIGLGLLVKELEKLAKEGFDFSAHLPVRKVFRLTESDALPNLPVPEFGSVEVAEKILGKPCYEVSKLEDVIYNLVSDKEIPVPPKQLITFGRAKKVSDYVIKLRYGNWIWSVIDVAKILIEEQSAIKRNEMYRKNVSGDYARSYQTKKNINKSTVDAMRNSGFNRFFNFVEFDNDVDVKKVEDIFKEFEAFNKFLYGEYVATPETTIRFRRLGNHKATGLYYPGIDCICIDINNPDSLVHEYGHMFDYHAGEVSVTDEFAYVRSEYAALLRSYIAKNGLELTGKYSLEYYLTPTEIFARCFEIYMKKKGMVNSIIYQEEGFAYPTDEMFVDAITRFFDSFFKNNVEIEAEGEPQKVACKM